MQALAGETGLPPPYRPFTRHSRGFGAEEEAKMRDVQDRLGKQVAATSTELRDAHDACVRCVQHCLRMGGMHAEVRHIRILLDTAELCQTCSAFMTRESDFHPRLCAVTAELCDRAAESCERIKDDEEMRTTALACRRAGDSCRVLAGV
jgi:hypothetical protein